MAMANPQPPPQTSFQESPPKVSAGTLTATGDINGDLCGKAPGKYPHMYTNLSLITSILSASSSPPPILSPFISKPNSGKEKKRNERKGKARERKILILWSTHKKINSYKCLWEFWSFSNWVGLVSSIEWEMKFLWKKDVSFSG